MIFLHSSFRTSSTYAWSHFRRAQNCVAYCEIFHEILVSISQEQLGSITPGSWDSKHPPGAPYFLEYLPLIQESGGIAGFDPSLSYERFIPPSGPSGAVSEAETAYVRTLVDHAEQRGRIPVLTDTRSLGRVAGLKQAVPGLHGVLYRNLYQQWCSYTEQAACGNPYFLETITKIAHLNRHDQVVRDLLRMFPVETPSTADTNTFYLFIFMHVYLYSHATAAADIVIDINRLAAEKSYRTGIEEVFAEQNVHVDFSDARESTAYSLVSFPCRADMLEQTQIISDAIIGKMPSERGRTMTAKIVADLLDEHERHEFYSKRLRSVLMSTRRDRDGALQAAEDGLRQVADLQGEHDRSVGEKNEAASVAEDLRRQLSDLQRECDRAKGEREQAVGTVEDTRRQLSDLQRECDRAKGEREQAVGTVEDTRRQLSDLQRECDRAKGERDDAASITEDARRQTEAMRIERDALGVEKDEATRATEEATREADALRDERDAAIRERAAIESGHRALGEDFVSLSATRDSLEAERDAALAARAESDRERALGEHRYAELLHWHLAFHDSTAASASWRLTRPLRWLGLGRPKRPPRPDFL